MSDVMKRATFDAMTMCAKRNLKLNKDEIAIKSKYACECMQRDTKAQNFTNRYNDFEEVARPVYEKAYSCAQEIFSIKFHLLMAMQADYEQYSFDSAYSRIQREVEHFVCWGDYGKGFSWYGE